MVKGDEFVKLISSDGHEFFVNRDCAMVSGTIKSMLTGPSARLLLLSSLACFKKK